MNLVPMDSVHPLYHNGAEGRALRFSFLADSFVDKDVDPEDAAMATEEGIKVTNMNGRELLFKSVDGEF